MADYSESESAISRGQDGSASNDAGQLDSAGQAILKLLHKAAGTAEANSRKALETAQKLSSQKDDVAELVSLFKESDSTSEKSVHFLFPNDVDSGPPTTNHIVVGVSGFSDGFGSFEKACAKAQ